MLPVPSMRAAWAKEKAAAVSMGWALPGDTDLVLHLTHVKALRIFLVKPPGWCSQPLCPQSLSTVTQFCLLFPRKHHPSW